MTADDFDALPPGVRAIILQDYERMLRIDFETLHWELLDGFVELDDIKPQWQSYLEDQWQDMLRGVDDCWDDYLAILSEPPAQPASVDLAS